MQSTSLRLRLFALILTPLLLMAVLLGYWRFTVAQDTAEELFDRSLLAAALAVSRDVAVSGGDALQATTRDLIRDASGGEVFYHVMSANGFYLTGYAYPPISVPGTLNNDDAPKLYEANYRGSKVRVLQLVEATSVAELPGPITVTVWQHLTDRHAFAREIAVRAIGLMGVLLVTLALVVWFGVARGLRPLLDLEDAIAMRSPDDLSQIKRPVPPEALGIVQTLNRLFGKVEASIDAHQNFISDAAHQLRNPAAAVQSMAESLRDAPTDEDRDERIAQLVKAARGSARVAEQLLSLDRLQNPAQPTRLERINLSELVRETSTEMGAIVLSQGIEFEVDIPDSDIFVNGDDVFIAETLKILIDNALKHAGKSLSGILVSLCSDGDQAKLTVSDDGKGLSPKQRDTAFSRFSQLEDSEGSGLGLSIASTVATRHGGALMIDDVESGASLTLSLPAA
jgi:two-component system sensor histidine kinase TctE